MNNGEKLKSFRCRLGGFFYEETEEEEEEEEISRVKVSELEGTSLSLVLTSGSMSFNDK